MHAWETSNVIAIEVEMNALSQSGSESEDETLNPKLQNWEEEREGGVIRKWRGVWGLSQGWGYVV
jgi:hypothetical protein